MQETLLYRLTRKEKEKKSSLTTSALYNITIYLNISLVAVKSPVKRPLENSKPLQYTQKQPIKQQEHI